MPHACKPSSQQSRVYLPYAGPAGGGRCTQNFLPHRSDGLVPRAELAIQVRGLRQQLNPPSSVFVLDIMARSMGEPRSSWPPPSGFLPRIFPSRTSPYALSRLFAVISRSLSRRQLPHRLATSSSYSYLSWRASLAAWRPSTSRSQHTSRIVPLTAHAPTFFCNSLGCPISALLSVPLSARSSFGTPCSSLFN
jgi:hypothetical protein